MKLIYADTIYTPLHIIHNGAVLIEDRKIVGVAERDKINITNRNIEVIDAYDKILSPGLINLHIHGGGGYDVMDLNYEALNSLSKFLTTQGVTSFLPTIYPKKLDKIIAAIENINNAIDKDTDGAKILGINFESHYINKKFHGAINEKYIKEEVDLEEFKKIRNKAKNNLKIVTLAPELKNAHKLIEYLIQNNIIPAVGHSDATYEEFQAAIELGVRYVTHVFNAMRPFHHRDTGLLGGILQDDRINCEVICDGVHIHKEVINILLRIKGISRIILITDAIRCTGLKEGEYKFNEKEVILKNDRILSKIDNKLAGSTLSMNKALKNLIEFASIDLKQALLTTTLNPARILKIDNKKGIIARGYDADLVILNKNLDVIMTIIEGKIVYDVRNIQSS